MADLGAVLGYTGTSQTSTSTAYQGRDLGAQLGFTAPTLSNADTSISGAQAFGRGVQASVAELNPINAAISIFSDSWKKGTEQYQANLNKAYEEGRIQHPIAAIAGTGAGSLLASAPLAASMNPSSLAGFAGTGAVQGGISSALSQMNTQGAVSPQSVAASSALGGALGGIGKGVSNLFGQPSKIASQVGKLATSEDIPLDTRNLINGGVLNRLPFATPHEIGVQQQEALTPAISRLIQSVSGKGEHVTEEDVGAQITAAANAAKTKANALYDNLAKITDSESVTPVDISKTKQLAQVSLDNLSALAPKSLKNTLNQFVTSPDSMNFSQLKSLRTDLGGLIDSYSAPGANKVAGGVVKQLYGQLSDDLDNWGTNNANSKIADAYNDASTYYKGYQSTFGNPTIRKALNNDVNMFNLTRQLATTKNTGRLQDIQNALGGNQDIARGFLVSDALQRSSAIQDGETMVDPGKFASLLRSHPEQVWGDHLDKIEAFANMANALKNTTGQPESHLITGGFAALAAEHLGEGLGTAVVPLGLMQRVINKYPNVIMGLKGVNLGDNAPLVNAVSKIKGLAQLIKPAVIGANVSALTPPSQ